MISNKVYQTIFEAGKGNALQACVASIFGADVHEVPNFIEAPSYANAIAEFVQAHYGLTFLKINISDGTLDFPVLFEPMVLAAGKSPRGAFKHVVVGKIKNQAIELVHDPYPDGNGLDGAPSWIGVFVKTF